MGEKIAGHFLLLYTSWIITSGDAFIIVINHEKVDFSWVDCAIDLANTSNFVRQVSETIQQRISALTHSSKESFSKRLLNAKKVESSVEDIIVRIIRLTPMIAGGEMELGMTLRLVRDLNTIGKEQQEELYTISQLEKLMENKENTELQLNRILSVFEQEQCIIFEQLVDLMGPHKNKPICIHKQKPNKVCEEGTVSKIEKFTTTESYSGSKQNYSVKTSDKPDLETTIPVSSTIPVSQQPTTSSKTTTVPPTEISSTDTPKGSIDGIKELLEILEEIKENLNTMGQKAINENAEALRRGEKVEIVRIINQVKYEIVEIESDLHGIEYLSDSVISQADVDEIKSLLMNILNLLRDIQKLQENEDHEVDQEMVKQELLDLKDKLINIGVMIHPMIEHLIPGKKIPSKDMAVGEKFSRYLEEIVYLREQIQYILVLVRNIESDDEGIQRHADQIDESSQRVLAGLEAFVYRMKRVNREQLKRLRADDLKMIHVSATRIVVELESILDEGIDNIVDLDVRLRKLMLDIYKIEGVLFRAFDFIAFTEEAKKFEPPIEDDWDGKDDSYELEEFQDDLESIKARLFNIRDREQGSKSDMGIHLKILQDIDKLTRHEGSAETETNDLKNAVLELNGEQKEDINKRVSRLEGLEAMVEADLSAIESLENEEMYREKEEVIEEELDDIAVLMRKIEKGLQNDPSSEQNNDFPNIYEAVNKSLNEFNQTLSKVERVKVPKSSAKRKKIRKELETVKSQHEMISDAFQSLQMKNNTVGVEDMLKDFGPISASGKVLARLKAKNHKGSKLGLMLKEIQKIVKKQFEALTSIPKHCLESENQTCDWYAHSGETIEFLDDLIDKIKEKIVEFRQNVDGFREVKTDYDVIKKLGKLYQAFQQDIRYNLNRLTKDTSTLISLLDAIKELLKSADEERMKIIAEELENTRDIMSYVKVSVQELQFLLQSPFTVAQMEIFSNKLELFEEKINEAKIHLENALSEDSVLIPNGDATETKIRRIEDELRSFSYRLQGVKTREFEEGNASDDYSYLQFYGDGVNSFTTVIEHNDYLVWQMSDLLRKLDHMDVGIRRRVRAELNELLEQLVMIDFAIELMEHTTGLTPKQIQNYIEVGLESIHSTQLIFSERLVKITSKLH